ncbi:hypothetical protein AcW1_009566 [Taiwanofungus camphoratus]|nr:hypothetical protein AcW1_009566 [Antrodia cinnamomea]
MNEQSCRKCDKEFNILFSRSRRCNHCGYSYCHSCTDFQALMPRGGTESGYDVVPVCAFCIDNLTITAGGKGHLRQLPLSRLKKYANAYNIRTSGVFEKDDLIDALISARGRNGCLLPAHEDYYRKYSVPNRRSGRPRGLFTRAMDAMGPDRPSTQPPPQQQQQQQQQQQPPPYQPRQRTTSGPSSFPRPDLDPRRQRQQRQAPPRPQRPRQPPPQPRNSRPQAYPSAGYPPHPPFSHPSSSSSANLNVPGGSAQARGRPRAASASPAPAPRMASPSPPVPTLDELLQMPDERLAALSIGTLKAVLFQNHVNARLVVEKEELVAKVRTLLEEERRERERHAREEEAERMAEEAMRWEGEQVRTRQESEWEEQDVTMEQELGGSNADGEVTRSTEGDTMQVDETHSQSYEDGSDENIPPPPPKTPTSGSTPPTRGLSPKAEAMASRLERTGLCVICQDEEANIAIVDCGHLALCRPCSDLIMKSTRECPLCRTRIVTEQRLLRIYRT